MKSSGTVLISQRDIAFPHRDVTSHLHRNGTADPASDAPKTKPGNAKALSSGLYSMGKGDRPRQ